MDTTTLITPSETGCIQQSQGKTEDVIHSETVVIDKPEDQILDIQTESFSTSDEVSTAFTELKTMIKLAIPVCITSIARVVMWNTDQIFLGHLGTPQLAGASLADTCSDMITFLVYSPAWALNGLCSQALGSGNRQMAGYWLQLTTIICTIICIPVSIGYFFVSDVIGLMSHDAEVVHYSSQFAHFAVMWLWTNAMLSSIRLFHQSLEIVTPFTIISTIAILFNIVGNQMWIHGFHATILGYEIDINGLGFVGSPLATSQSFMLQLLMSFVWCFLIRKYYIEYGTWSGWSLKNTICHAKRVKELLKVVVPITITNCSENWAYQFITLYAAKLVPAEIAAMTCTFAVWGILWSFYNGFGVSIVTRLGKKIGSGKIDEAKMCAKVGLLLSVVACFSTATVVYLLSNYVSTIYTNDPEVIRIMKPCIKILCFTYAIGGIGWAAMAILEAMSKNKVKGIINVLCAWFGYVPACVFLMTGDHSYKYIGLPPVCSIFVVGLAVEFVRASSLWVAVCRTDWHKASEEAQVRNERYDELVKDDIDDVIVDKQKYRKFEEDDKGGCGKDKMSIGGAYDHDYTC